MSKQSEEFVRLARDAEQQALKHEAEMRDLMLSIADAFMLLAHVQKVVDNPRCNLRTQPIKCV